MLKPRLQSRNARFLRCDGRLRGCELAAQRQHQRIFLGDGEPAEVRGLGHPALRVEVDRDRDRVSNTRGAAYYANGPGNLPVSPPTKRPGVSKYEDRANRQLLDRSISPSPVNER